MPNKIEEIKNIRKEIGESYSSKKIPLSNIDKIAHSSKDWQDVVISKIIDETSDVKSFILSPLTQELEPFIAGQYVGLEIKIGEFTTVRSYTLSSSCEFFIYMYSTCRISDGHYVFKRKSRRRKIQD